MHCWARTLCIVVVSMLGMGQMFAACGQKGDLYLPEPEEGASQQTRTDVVADPAPRIETDEEQKVDDKAVTDSGNRQPGQE